MMNTTSAMESADKKSIYKLLSKQLKGVIGQVPYLISNLANASALLNETLTDINWVGFYLMEDGKLVLGPFQGKLACT
ncbi:GAF domain-containing protein [Bariatricus sp. SGI.154]|uniref:GAF domain-containing protein n=1 Tax=Bariatricus sp. SGI.154 TaxID=3420549 RepID=UPI003CFDCA24